MSNFNVTALPAYVENNKELLLKNFGLVGGNTRKRIGIQTGIKKDAYLNFLELNPTLQDGKGCGFEAQGSAPLTQRTISTALLKINLSFCPDDLIGKWAEYLVKVAHTPDALPFEAEIAEGLVAEINKKVENLIWKGDKSSSNVDLKWIDGILKVAAGESDVITVTNGNTSAYADIKAVYAALPEEVLERGAEIYVSPAKFRAFVQELVAANLYHYDPMNQNLDEFLLPGSDCKVVKTAGLAGSNSIVGTFAKNLVYGCDMENGTEDIKVIYDEKTEEYLVKAKWNSGVQIAFPNMVVLGA